MESIEWQVSKGTAFCYKNAKTPFLEPAGLEFYLVAVVVVVGLSVQAAI